MLGKGINGIKRKVMSQCSLRPVNWHGPFPLPLAVYKGQKGDAMLRQRERHSQFLFEFLCKKFRPHKGPVIISWDNSTSPCLLINQPFLNKKSILKHFLIHKKPDGLISKFEFLTC